MKILMFSQYYFPEKFLIHEIAERLVEQGHEVTVVTGLPNYGFPGGRIPDEYLRDDKSDEQINGVRVLRCRIMGRGTSKLRLLGNYFTYMLRANGVAKKPEKDYDVVFCYQLTPVLQLYPAIRYCREHEKKLLCYCLDLAPESGIRLLKRFPVSSMLYTKFSQWAYQHCDNIAVTSQSFIDYLADVNGVERSRLFYLPQHAPDNLLTQDLSKPHGETADFLFAGNLGTGGALSTIVYAAEVLVKSGVTSFRVHLVGEGSVKNELIALTHALQLEDYVLFHDGVPASKMPEIYQKADALLITLRKGQMTIPGKLQAYMAAGKPILGAMGGSGKELIGESECGRCVEAEDHTGLASLMMAYIENPQTFDVSAANGRRYFRENFTADIFIDKLTQLLDKTKEGVQNEHS